MASYYQPSSYFKGGKRRKTTRRRVLKGGFYPSIMSNLLHHGRMLIPAALRQGSLLFNSNKRTRKNRK